MIFPLLFLAVCRGNTVGGDLENYLPYYNQMYLTKSWSEMIELIGFREPGYSIFIKILGYFTGGSERYYILVTSICSLIGPFYLIYKYSNNYSYSLLLYYALGFYTNTFNNIRQSIAMSIVFISFYYLFENRNLIKYILMVLLATTFHYSALIMVLLYPLTKNVISIKFLIKLILISFSLFFLAGSNILKIIITNFLFKYNPDTFFESGGSGWGL